MPNWVENVLVVDDSSKTKLKEILIAISGEDFQFDEDKCSNNNIRIIDFNRIIPVPVLIDEESDESFDCRVDYWGTKWNSTLNRFVSANQIFFLTAWDPPFIIIEKLGLTYPDVVLKLYYSSESGRSGIYHINKGIIIHDYSDLLNDKFEKQRVRLKELKHKFEKEL